jgi:hypothetical protein
MTPSSACARRNGSDRPAGLWRFTIETQQNVDRSLTGLGFRWQENTTMSTGGETTMTDRTQSTDSRKNSGGAGEAAHIDRPATAPAHYLGVPAEVWMGVFRQSRSRRKNGPGGAPAGRA